ncbi:hypothetical protein J6S88_06230 [bacterium]|nr:hypothetical protein [bacterium]
MYKLYYSEKFAYIYGIKNGKKTFITKMLVQGSDDEKKVLKIINDHPQSFLFDPVRPLSISFEKLDI